MQLILGSSSPYKRQLLERAGYQFLVEDSKLDERKHHLSTVEATVKHLSELKAQCILERHPNEDSIIVTTDVAGELEGHFLGKPGSLEQAVEMIQSYSGKLVLIWCATTIATRYNVETHIKTHLERAEIQFADLSRQQILQYVKEKNPLDKGGAIAIEEIEERGFVKSVQGEYAAIIGISIQFVQEYLPKVLKN